MFGYNRNELLGRPLEILAPERSSAAYAELLACESGPDTALSRPTRDLAGLHKDGSVFPVELTLNPVEAGEGSLIVLAFRDVSEQKQAQEELRARVSQQAVVSELGRRALTGIDLLQLMGEAAVLARSNLGVEYVNVLELMPDGSILFEAGAGWEEGLVGQLVTDAVDAIPAAQVLLTQTPVIVEDFSVDDRFPDASSATTVSSAA